MSNNTEISDSSVNTEDVINTESDTEMECLIDTMLETREEKQVEIVSKEDRISKNKLTRYEFVRLIGERTKQLTMGAKPLIRVNEESEDLSYSEIAIEELKLNMIPFKIKRPVNNTIEIWDIEELDKSHLFSIMN